MGWANVYLGDYNHDWHVERQSNTKMLSEGKAVSMEDWVVISMWVALTWTFQPDRCLQQPSAGSNWVRYSEDQIRLFEGIVRDQQGL